MQFSKKNRKSWFWGNTIYFCMHCALGITAKNAFWNYEHNIVLCLLFFESQKDSIDVMSLTFYRTNSGLIPQHWIWSPEHHQGWTPEHRARNKSWTRQSIAKFLPIYILFDYWQSLSEFCADYKWYDGDSFACVYLSSAPWFCKPYLLFILSPLQFLQAVKC